MSILESQLEFKAMADDPEFGESIVYTHSAIPKSINAVVYRGKASFSLLRLDRGSEGKVNQYTMAVRVNTHSTYGIAAVTKNSDTVSVPKTIGGTAVVGRVVEILEQDPGTWLLALAI